MWLVDNQGNASDDPRVMLGDPPGAILPLGGVEQGYKGFALGLLVEALTSGLAGYGRADGEKGWGASVFMQLLDPAAFGGRERFSRETGWLAQACRTTPVKPGNPAVRLPGERALALRRLQLQAGVALHPEVMPALVAFAHDGSGPAAVARADCRRHSTALIEGLAIAFMSLAARRVLGDLWSRRPKARSHGMVRRHPRMRSFIHMILKLRWKPSLYFSEGTT